MKNDLNCFYPAHMQSEDLKPKPETNLRMHTKANYCSNQHWQQLLLIDALARNGSEQLLVEMIVL